MEGSDINGRNVIGNKRLVGLNVVPRLQKTAGEACHRCKKSYRKGICKIYI